MLALLTLKIPGQLDEEVRSPAHFDATAEGWDRTYEEPTLRGHWRRSRLAAALELIGEGPGDLLEIGAGPGRLLAALASRGWTVSGIDPAPNMVELARARLPPAAGSLTVGRAEALPFAEESFDVVAAIGVLEYAQLEQALKEITRILRPRGRAVIGIRNARAPAGIWHRSVVYPIARPVKRAAPFGWPAPMPRRRPLSPRQYRYALRVAGLALVRVENAGCALLADPFDRLFPELAVRMAERAERHASLRRLLGTQRLLLAAKS